MGDVGPATPLPPLNNLPQWSRVNTFDKARYPKPFPKDRLQPPPPGAHGGGPGGGGGLDPGGVAVSRRSSSGSNPELDPIPETGGVIAVQRVQYLERSIRFLTHQHKDTLTSLHEEIEKLKRANKELQFRLMIAQKGLSPPHSPTKQRGLRGGARGAPGVPPHKLAAATAAAVPAAAASAGPGVATTAAAAQSQGTQPAAAVDVNETRTGDPVEPSTAPNHDANTPSQPADTVSNTDATSEAVDSQSTEDAGGGERDELQLLFLEEELRELKRSLQAERTRNSYLAQLLAQAQKLKVQPQSEALREDGSGVVAQTSPPAQQGGSAESTHLPFNATISPLQVHLPMQPARPPTLAEVEVILTHLQQLNDKQAHELSQLKTDLRDVLYSHKWTPEAYLLAKAYVREDDAVATRDADGTPPTGATRDRLPRIQPRQSTKRIPDYAAPAPGPRDSVMLPALTQTLGTKAIERRKRTQGLQRTRVGREVSSLSSKLD